MNIKHPAICATLGLTLALSAPFATAALINAGATITNLQFHVADLTPGDAQAGGITIDRSYTAYSVATSYFWSEYFPDFRASNGSLAEQGRRAWTSSSDGLGELQARTENSYIPAYGSSYHATAGISQGMLFWLLPHSSISLSGHAGGFVQRDAGVDGGYGVARTINELRNEDSSYALLGLVAKSVSLSDTVGDAAYSEDFLFEYANNSDTPMRLSWNVYTSSEAWLENTDPLPPVPEPASYAMLGLGLMLIAAKRRRQQR